VTLELESLHAEVARKNIDRAGLGALVDIRVGPATQSLQGLIDGDTKSFDFIFIDADKEGYPNYLVLSLQLSRPGTIMLRQCDSRRRGGQFDERRRRVNGVRAFLEMAAASDRVEGTAIQTVGSKGYDGFALLVVTR